jgi:hypothetical protein
MAMLDTHLLDDLDAFRLLEGDWTDGGDDFVDFVLDGCLWCTTGEAGDCRHAIGQVEAGVLTLGGLPGDGGRRLASLLERLASSIVLDRPLPIECRDLPESDRLVTTAEAAWMPLRDAARRDPDTEAWTRILADRLAEAHAAWCFSLLCSLSGGTMHRLDDSAGGERWIAAEPELLGAALDACLRGDRDGWAIADDPLRRSRPAASICEQVA